MIKPFLTRELCTDTNTLALGRVLGTVVRAGYCIALTVPLGAGKTTLARGLIRAFVGADVEVPSPTFTLLQTYSSDARYHYSAPVAGIPLYLFHFDLYRLKLSDEVWELGWEDIKSGIALVEWPDKAGENLPDDRLDIHLSFEGEGRMVQFYARDEQCWKDRLHGL
jgi:tRNA threonylcarbamoyladenosine biosynthesis protein TsaE